MSRGVEDFLYQDPMINCVICCRQVNEFSSNNHAILVVILDVFSEIQELAGAQLPGLKPDFSFIRRDSNNYVWNESYVQFICMA